MMLVVSFGMFAHDFEVDGIYYKYVDKQTKTVMVSCKGNYHGSYANEYVGSVSIPKTVACSDTIYTVVSIEDGAFANCGELTSITIPITIDTIGPGAFQGCSGLTSVVIPGSYIGRSAFDGCKGLTSVVIGDSVTVIGDHAFEFCNKLKRAKIGNSVRLIGEWAFADCDSLMAIDIPNSVSKIGLHAFSSCALKTITIGNSVVEIGDMAFMGCSGLEEVNFNAEECAIMGSYNSVFNGCVNLRTVNIGATVKKIPSYAFKGCSGLTSVDIPNSVSKIGTCAFADCALKTITIGNSVAEIGVLVFMGCSELEEVNFNAEDCEIIGNVSLNPIFRGCTNLKIINIGTTVKKIPSYAFYGCGGFTSIYIPAMVSKIGEGAFKGCVSLSSIKVSSENNSYDSRNKCNAIIETSSNTLIVGCQNTVIPNSVTAIAENAFNGIHISEMHLPKSVTFVGQMNNCADVCYCYNPTPPTGGGYTSNRLFVPKGSFVAYSTAEGWKSASQILEFEEEDVDKHMFTIVYPEGGVVSQKVENGTILELQIVPSDGWKCNTVTFNGTDVTDRLDANGTYNTPSITTDSQLNVVFVKNSDSVLDTFVDGDIKVYVKGDIVTIIGADEYSDVEIYDMAGMTIYKGNEKVITLDNNGIYILTIEGQVFKFAM